MILHFLLNTNYTIDCSIKFVIAVLILLFYMAYIILLRYCFILLLFYVVAGYAKNLCTGTRNISQKDRSKYFRFFLHFSLSK